MDASLSQILDFTRFLMDSKATFYLNIKTANGLKFKIDAKPGNPTLLCPNGNGEREKKWKTPTQIARARKRLQAFHEQKRSEKENMQKTAAVNVETEELARKLDKLATEWMVTVQRSSPKY